MLSGDSVRSARQELADRDWPPFQQPQNFQEPTSLFHLSSREDQAP